MDKCVRILYILGGSMKYGGTEAFIINYYRNINKENVIIDFVYQGDEKGVYDDELIACGSNIYHTVYKNQNPILFSKQIAEIIKKNNYKIIHSQMDAMGAWPLLIAKFKGVPVRIAHSHNTAHQTNNKIQILVNDLAKTLLRKVSTHYFACGKEAGKWLFGEKLFEKGKVEVIHNAINLDDYSFSNDKRMKIRNEFSIKDSDILIGHVGQFRKQKNHEKIIEIFHSLVQQNVNYKLMLVGSGELEDSIKELCQKLNILDHVIFTGSRNDVSTIMNAFDLFLFPSLFEGLSVVAVEAQANGVPCVFSNTISNETFINDNIDVVDLNASEDIWTNAINKAIGNGRINSEKAFSSNGYNIKVEAKKLEKKYLDLQNKAIGRNKR